MAGCCAPARLTATAIAETRSINRIRVRKVIRVTCPPSLEPPNGLTCAPQGACGTRSPTEEREHDCWIDVTRGFDVQVMKTDDFRPWLTLIASALCPEMVTR